jgi:hypothetical protein
LSALAALPDAEIVACRGLVVALDHHVSHQGLPWVSGLLESVSGPDRFEVWPVPYRKVVGLACGARVAFVAKVDLRGEPKLKVESVEVLP